MLPCAMSIHLREEVHRLVTILHDLVQRKHIAVVYRHENTLAAIHRTILRVTEEKDRATADLEQHRRKHGCA